MPKVKHYQQQWEKIPKLDGTLPSGEPRYRLRDGYRRVGICLTNEMREAMDAVKAQLLKDRKLLYVQGHDLPLKPSINSIALKAIELMLWGSKDKHADKPTKQASKTNKSG